MGMGIPGELWLVGGWGCRGLSGLFQVAETNEKGVRLSCGLFFPATGLLVDAAILRRCSGKICGCWQISIPEHFAREITTDKESHKAAVRLANEVLVTVRLDYDPMVSRAFRCAFGCSDESSTSDFRPSLRGVVSEERIDFRRSHKRHKGNSDVLWLFYSRQAEFVSDVSPCQF